MQLLVIQLYKARIRDCTGSSVLKWSCRYFTRGFGTFHVRIVNIFYAENCFKTSAKMVLT